MIVMFITIISVFVVSAIVLFYLSAVTFTAVRANEHNVKFSLPTLFLIPLILVGTHMKIYNEHKLSDRKKAFRMFLFIFKKYPVALAMFLTIITTNVAEQNVRLNNGANYRKSKSLYQKKRKKSIDKVLKGNVYGDMLWGT